MGYPNSVSKQLEILNMSGYGSYTHLSSHSELGRGVCEVDLDACVLGLFEKGVAIKFNGEDVGVLYSDIVNIASHLSVEVFSQASASRSFNISIPLEIHL